MRKGYILVAALVLGMSGCGNTAGMEGYDSIAESEGEGNSEGIGEEESNTGAENKGSNIGTENQGNAAGIGGEGSNSGTEDDGNAAGIGGKGSNSGTEDDGNAAGIGGEGSNSGTEDNGAAAGAEGEGGTVPSGSRETASEEENMPSEEGRNINGGINMDGIDILQVPEWPQAEIPVNDALAFVESMRLGWNLGNTFDAVNCNVSDELQYESAWSKAVTTKEMIRAVAEAGFRTIRIPVSWHNHMDENCQISSAWMDRVQEVADWALEEDMYVIINIHHDNEEGFLYPSYEQLEQSRAYVRCVWTQIAERFADYDEKLIFETLNEPRQIGTDHEWWVDVNSRTGKECLDVVNQLNQEAVDTIRENGKGYNSARYIMVPGYCASPDFALADDFILPTDSGGEENRILVSVHAYMPYNFALAGETDQNSTDQFSISGQKGTGEIDAFMEKLYEKFVSNGIGVVIGEFGARIKGGNTQARTEFAAYYVARARHYGMTACWWDNNAFAGNGENFGLFRRADSTFAFPEIVAQMMYYSRGGQ